MKCVCPMGGDRDCPGDCTYVKWAALSKSDQKAQRRMFVAELHAKKYSQEQIGRMLDVAQKTVSRDLETLVTVTNVQTDRGTDTLGRKKSTGRPKENKLNPNRRKNTSPHAKAAAQQILDEGKSYSEVEQGTGLSNIVLRSAVAREEGRREAEPTITPDMLSLTAQQKLDAAIKQHKHKLGLEFEKIVQATIQERVRETVLPAYNKSYAEYSDVIKARKGVMDRATFNKVRRALHPDSRNSISDKVLAEAFDTFMALEKRLLNEADAPTSFIKFPTTYEEMMQMRQRAADNRKAKRAVSRR